jgi:hypothetical protein
VQLSLKMGENRTDSVKDGLGKSPAAQGAEGNGKLREMGKAREFEHRDH